MNLFFLDFETTGLNPYYNDPIEIAIKKYNSEKNFQSFMIPNQFISSKITDWSITANKIPTIATAPTARANPRMSIPVESSNSAMTSPTGGISLEGISRESSSRINSASRTGGFTAACPTCTWPSGPWSWSQHSSPI